MKEIFLINPHIHNYWIYIIYKLNKSENLYVTFIPKINLFKRVFRNKLKIKFNRKYVFYSIKTKLIWGNFQKFAEEGSIWYDGPEMEESPESEEGLIQSQSKRAVGVLQIGAICQAPCSPY